MSFENHVKLAVPLKHPEDTYIFTYNPKFSGPLTIEIISSQVRSYMLAKNDEDTTIKKKENSPIILPPVPLNKGKKCFRFKDPCLAVMVS